MKNYAQVLLLMFGFSFLTLSAFKCIDGVDPFIPADNQGPIITITSHTNPDTVLTQEITLAGTVTDTSGIYQFLVNDSLQNVTNNTWQVDNLLLTSSVNIITIKAYDNSPAQNLTDTSIMIIYKDTLPNHAPVFISDSSDMEDTAYVNAQYKDTVHAVDIDGDTLTFSFIDSVVGMVLTDSIITWTPTAGDTGSKPVKVKVDDGKGMSDSLSWTINISLQMQGLVAYWDFNDGSGTTLTDKSGNGNHGTISGATWVDGIDGKALSFDGIDDWVEALDKDIQTGMTQLTISAWFKLQLLDSTSTIFEKWGPQSSSDDSYCLTCDKVIKFSLHNGNDIELQSDSIVRSNIWYYVTAVYNNDLVKIYLNGNLVKSIAAGTGPIQNTDININIGKHNKFGGGSMDYFSGAIDEIRIYNKALSDDEIKALWEAHKEAATLIAYWDFNEGSGTTLTDKSIYGNNGTINGATWVDGQEGKALSFDGTDDFVSISNSLNTGLNFTGNELSISTWIKPSGIGPSTQDIVDCSHTMTGYRFGYRPGNHDIKFSLNEATSFASDSGVTPNQWNHAVGVYKSDSLCIWINGKYYGSKYTDFGVRKSPVVMTVGAYRNASAEQFNGIIDETRIYNRGLTETEIQELADTTRVIR